MDLFRQHYDRAALLAAVLFLLLSSVFIFLGAAGFSGRFSALQNVPLPDNKIPVGQAPEIAQAMQKLESPQQWMPSGRSGLFVPEKHFIGDNGEPVTLQNTLLHAPVPNEWLEEFGLPMTEADVLTQDADSDGFTNRDEWDAQTNPTEKISHPPYTFKLKLRSFSEEPFPLIFSSSVADTYAINNVNRSKPTQFLRLGEMVKGTRYKLKDYIEKHETDKYGTVLDVSELTLEQVDTHDVVRLVKEKRAISPESVANFIYTWGGTERSFAVKKDQEFSIRPQEEVKYRLLEVNLEKAIIVPAGKPEEKIEIRLAAP